METRNLTCINCPLGCQLTVTLDSGNVMKVVGNTCPRGDGYARKEVTNPTRIVTSSVQVFGAAGGEATVSCKTARDVPKGSIFAVMQALRGVAVKAPVRIGDVLVPNVAGTGVDIVATRNVG